MWLSYRTYFLPIIISLMVGITLIAATYSTIPELSRFLSRVERQYYDFNLLNSAPRKPITPPAIILIDFDEHSLSQIGGWPRPRKETSDLLENLAQFNPRLIALTSTFAFPNLNPVDEIENKFRDAKKKLPKEIYALRDSLDEDLILRNTLKKHGIIISYLLHDQSALTGLLDINKGKAIPDPFLQTGWQTRGYTANDKKYQEASGDEGFIASHVDTDGVLRSFSLILQSDNFLYPALALTIAKHYYQTTDYKIILKEQKNRKVYQGIQLGEKFIPTDSLGRILVPYQFDLSQFKRISALDIIEDKSFTELKDAIVIVGSSANSLGNLKSTPLQSSIAEFEAQALALQGLLHPQTLWYQPSWWYQLIIAELIFILITSLVLFPLCRPNHLLVLSFLLFSTLMFSHYLLHEWYQAYIAPTTPLILAAVIALLFLVAGLFVENRNRLQLQLRFGQYVPPEHIQRLLNDPKAVNLEGERREMTVLFADLHDFTQISENISTQDLKHFLNRYLTHATKTIFNYRGTIDKYIGDLIMAFWGAPLPQANHAEQSVRAALALQQMLKQRQSEFAIFGIPEVKLGIGINTGEMNVGEMGSDYRRAYTVLGDAVNIAARLEPLTRFYQVDILVSEATKNQCPNIFFRTIDRIKVKGKQQCLTVFEPIGLTNEITEAQQVLYNLYEIGLAHCYAQRWNEALGVLEQVLQQQPNDPVTQLYLKRVKDCICTPVPYWTGVQDHLQK